MPDVELELADHVTHRDKRRAAVVACRDLDTSADGGLEERDQALAERLALLDDEVRDAGCDRRGR